MTLRELSQLYYLQGEIKLYERQLEELEATYGVGSPALDGMPHGKGGAAASRTEQLAADIADIKAIIHVKKIACIHERARLERYIAEIPDSITRHVFVLRFVEGMQWEDIASSLAEELGRDRTVYAVKKRCYRYLDQEQS